jgi:hypothetical protein
MIDAPQLGRKGSKISDASIQMDSRARRDKAENQTTLAGRYGYVQYE